MTQTSYSGLQASQSLSISLRQHVRIARPILLTATLDELYSLTNLTGEFMDDSIVVTALDARANFGKLLRRVEDEGRSLVIEKRGSPRAVLLSIKDYVRLAVPEPEVLRIIGKESKQKGTNKLSSRQIDRIVRASRRSKSR
jgi:prevent-host-death family protein